MSSFAFKSLCSEFALALNDGEDPRIEQFLERIDESQRLELLRDLILIELGCHGPKKILHEHDFLTRFSDQQEVVANAFVRFREGLNATVDTQVTQATQDCKSPWDDAAVSSAAETLAPTAIKPWLGTARGQIKYFGEYELLDEVARGGMGVVFKARQVKLNRIVALKMILSGNLAGREEVERFKKEAEAAANLNHSGIVPIYEIGEHDGQHFFSMGFVEGQSLGDRVKDGPLPPNLAAELTKKISDAIAYAHEQGVIHRDLKPANVLLDSKGEPKVTDFGLARKLEQDSGLTRTGTVMGTPSYMPPEQAAGKTGQVGPLADVYSLGAILYCLLTGRPPFQAASPLDTLRQVLEREPVAPRQLNPLVPNDLETICLKCLQKDPIRRYASALELAADITRWQKGEPILARPAGRLERLWRWSRRNQRVAAMGAAIFLLLAILVVGSWLSNIHLREINRQALKDRQVANESESRRTEQLLDSLQVRARLGRATRMVGQRFEGLNAVAQAAGIRPSAELRNEAIACMSLPDVRPATNVSELDPPTDARVGVMGQTSENPLTGEVALPNHPNSGDVTIVDKDGETVHLLHHATYVDTVLFSRDGKLLAVSCTDSHDVSIWRLPSCELQSVLKGHKGGVFEMEFSHSGNLLLTSGYETSTRLWDPLTGRLLFHTVDQVFGGSFFPDDKHIWNHGQPMELSNAPECQILRHSSSGLNGDPKGKVERAWSVAYASDGSLFSVSTPAVQWDPKSLVELGRRPDLRVIAPIPNGGLCAIKGSDVVRLKSLEDSSGVSLYKIRTKTWVHSEPPRIAVSADSHWLAVAEIGVDRLALIDLHGVLPTRDLPQPECFDVAFSPDGKMVATTGWHWDPEVPARVWSVATGDLLHEFIEPSFARLSFSPNGRQLVLGCQNVYQFWDTATWRLVRSVARRSNVPGPSCFSSDGTMIAILTTPYEVKILDPNTGNEYAVLCPPEPTPFSDLCFSPDSQKIVALTGNELGYVWDLSLIRKHLKNIGLDWFENQGPTGLSAVVEQPESATNFPSTTVKETAEQAPPDSVLIVENASKASWDPDGIRIVYGTNAGSGIQVCNTHTQGKELIRESGKDPSWSPNGRYIAFVVGDAPEDEMIWVMRPDGTDARRLTSGGYPTWSSDGTMLYFRTMTPNVRVRSVAVDADKAAAQLAFDVEGLSYYPAVSPDGKLVAFQWADSLVIADRTGTITQRVSVAGWRGCLPSWSADSRFVSYGSYGFDDSGAWVLDVELGTNEQLLSGPYTKIAWASDNSRIAFDRRATDGESIWMMDVGNRFVPETSVQKE